MFQNFITFILLARSQSTDAVHDYDERRSHRLVHSNTATRRLLSCSIDSRRCLQHLLLRLHLFTLQNIQDGEDSCAIEWNDEHAFRKCRFEKFILS